MVDLKAAYLKIEGANFSCTALGDNSRGIYILNLVNIDAERKVTLTGLLQKINHLRIWVTGKNSAMKKERSISVLNAKAVFSLAHTSYTTLQSE